MHDCLPPTADTRQPGSLRGSRLDDAALQQFIDGPAESAWRPAVRGSKGRYAPDVPPLRGERRSSVLAFDIETAANGEEQALLTSASQLGYRGALLVTDALILILAASVGWVLSYQAMAAIMFPTSLMMQQPNPDISAFQNVCKAGQT